MKDVDKFVESFDVNTIEHLYYSDFWRRWLFYHKKELYELERAVFRKILAELHIVCKYFVKMDAEDFQDDVYLYPDELELYLNSLKSRNMLDWWWDDEGLYVIVLNIDVKDWNRQPDMPGKVSTR